jgi:predicted O-methyltransferase YrrM
MKVNLEAGTYHAKALWLILRSYPSAAVVARYVSHYAGKLVGRRTLAPDVKEARDRFRSAAASRQFTQDWFDNNIPTWTAKLRGFAANRPQPRILEVGSYEGRSTLFLLTHFPTAHITVVDLWSASGGERSAIESRFDANVAEHAARITKHRGRSAEVLGRLASGAERFDLIYIDGSHFADDVIVDATLSWSLLNPGGVIIFDDYIWLSRHHDARKSGCRAINLFLRLMEGEYRILHVAHQIILQKAT